MNKEHEVRTAIARNLRQLRNDLGGFEQTTHGTLGRGSIEAVTSDLESCWDEPTPYWISNLSQHIEQFLKKEGFDL